MVKEKLSPTRLLSGNHSLMYSIKNAEQEDTEFKKPKIKFKIKAMGVRMVSPEQA